MAKKKMTTEQKLKRTIKGQRAVIRILSNKEIVKGLNTALEDFKHGRYTILAN
jgi:hypothetical protein